MSKHEEAVTEVVGNLYEALGFADPVLETTKAQLARQIISLIDGRGLTQVQAAEALGVDQPRVSHLVRGRLGKFSVETLLEFITRLGVDVDITMHEKDTPRPAKISVYPVAPGLSEGRNYPPMAAVSTKTKGVQFS